MPRSEIVFYKEGETVPLRDWLKRVSNKAQKKCLTFITQLEMRRHELRRPLADFLRDGIYELRPSYQGAQHRILYFFGGKDVVVQYRMTLVHTMDAAAGVDYGNETKVQVRRGSRTV